jgi:hypothetical protein
VETAVFASAFFYPLRGLGKRPALTCSEPPKIHRTLSSQLMSQLFAAPVCGNQSDKLLSIYAVELSGPGRLQYEKSLR